MFFIAHSKSYYCFRNAIFLCIGFKKAYEVLHAPNLILRQETKIFGYPYNMSLESHKRTQHQTHKISSYISYVYLLPPVGNIWITPFLSLDQLECMLFFLSLQIIVIKSYMHIKNFGSRREMLTLNMDVSKLDPISEKLLKKCYRWYRSHRPNDFILR